MVAVVSHALMIAWIAASSVTIVACYAPRSEQSCTVSCVAGACPVGLTCDRTSDRCVAPGDSCAISSDGSVDVPPGSTGVRIEITGAGAGDVSVALLGSVQTCSSACTILASPGDTVDVAAVASRGSWFRGWTTGCKTGRRDCKITLGEGVVTITADFTAEPNIIFVSSATTTGDFAVVDNEMFCTNAALSAGLGGTRFAAFASVEGIPWYQRIGPARGWIRRDGMPVVDKADALATQAQYAAIQLTERGDFVELPSRVWGMNRDVGDCGSWKSADVAAMGTAIDAERGAHQGAGGSARACSMLAHVFCAQIDRVVEVVPVPDRAGRVAFTSAATFDMVSGRAAADELCQTEAGVAQLTGTFLAFLAASSETALSRFDLAGEPWVRVDGIPLTPTAKSWETVTHLDAAPDRTAAGVDVGNVRVLIPTPTELGTLDNTCQNWTSTMGTTPAGQGWQTRIASNSTTPCSSPTRVLCMQQ